MTKKFSGFSYYLHTPSAFYRGKGGNYSANLILQAFIIYAHLPRFMENRAVIKKSSLQGGFFCRLHEEPEIQIDSCHGNTDQHYRN